MSDFISVNTPLLDGNEKILGRVQTPFSPPNCRTRRSAGFRESRDNGGSLSFVDLSEEAKLIEGLAVVEVRLGKRRNFKVPTFANCSV